MWYKRKYWVDAVGELIIFLLPLILISVRNTNIDYFLSLRDLQLLCLYLVIKHNTYVNSRPFGNLLWLDLIVIFLIKLNIKLYAYFRV